VSTVPSGEPSSRDESKLQPSTRVFEEMRERPQLCVWGGFTEGERTLREDWPVVDGGWRCTGVEELPRELEREWRFLGSGVPEKQLRSRRKAGRARSVPGTQPDPRFWHQMLGKMPLSKKTHVHRTKFNNRPKLPGWPGKRWHSPEPGQAVAFIEGGG
jgi:hypothetical protein